jgi:hypothetical protein
MGDTPRDSFLFNLIIMHISDKKVGASVVERLPKSGVRFTNVRSVETDYP